VLAANPADIPLCRAPRNRAAASTQLKENAMNTFIDVAADNGVIHAIDTVLMPK
jgi:uncharacterized surface protein with fasciclin (FAS1) repeats